MTKIKIENELSDFEDSDQENEEEINEEKNVNVETENFKPRKIFDGEKKQTLAEIYNDETLKEIQKPPRAPIRKFFIGLVFGFLIGLVFGFIIAILFLRYF